MIKLDKRGGSLNKIIQDIHILNQYDMTGKTWKLSKAIAFIAHLIR